MRYTGTVPAQGVDSANLVADCRRRLGVSSRELARRLGCSHPSILRWERGIFRPPLAVEAELLRLVAETETRSADLDQAMLRRVRDEPGVNPSVLRGLGREESERVDRLFGAGLLEERRVVRPDARGRRYERDGLYLPEHPAVTAPASPLDRGRLRAMREQRGWTVEHLALEARVKAPTIRGWETGHQAIPAGRAEQLLGLLDPPPTREELRGARLAAHWTLAQIGELVGVDWQRVAQWERGDRHGRPIPARWREGVASAIRQAQAAAAAGEHLAATTDAVVEWVGAHPGVTPNSLRHRYGGRDWPAAVAKALGGGRVVERVADEPGPRGGHRRLTRCYLPDAAPAPAEEMTGGELRHARESRGLITADIAALVGVSPGAISGWERRAEANVPPWHVAALRRALVEAVPTLHGGRRGRAVITPAAARDRVLVAVAKGPIGRTKVLLECGRSPTVLAALDELLRAGRIVEDEALDSLGRRERVLRLVQAAGDALDDPMSASELRALMAATGWNQTRLAEALGVSSSKVSQWAGGSRAVPRGRAGRIRQITRQAPPAGADPVEVELAGLVDLLVPGVGRTWTELRAHSREHRPAAIDLAVERGRAHWAERTVAMSNGRFYTRRELLAGPAPAAEAAGSPAAALSGEQLGALMRDAGLNQSQLAGRLSLGQPSVWRWTRTGVPPARVAQVLDALQAGAAGA